MEAQLAKCTDQPGYMRNFKTTRSASAIRQSMIEKSQMRRVIRGVKLCQWIANQAPQSQTGNKTAMVHTPSTAALC